MRVFLENSARAIGLGVLDLKYRPIVSNDCGLCENRKMFSLKLRVLKTRLILY